ncbi:MAG TPA: acyltransferase [Acidimicrobiia bacterium]|jgi:peptidoglycan/LPS O-acetylase OafA/YrhL
MAAPDAVRPQTQPSSRFPCFDGLRALAALSVLLTHVAFASGANSASILGVFFARMDGGVAVFFVLSGFLLYRPFILAHVRGRPAPAAGPFLWRRFLRIYPAYWLVVTVVIYVFADKSIPSAKVFFLDYSLLNVYFSRYAFGPLVQSWTLSAEIAFYVLVPIWAFVVSRRTASSPRDRLRREIVGIVVLVLVSTLYKAVVIHADLPFGRVGQLKQLLPWWLDLFGVGMLFAVGSVAVAESIWPTPLRLDRRWAPAVCWALAVAAFWLVSAGIGLPWTTPAIPVEMLWGQHYLYGLTGALLVLPAVFGPQERDTSLIRRFLTTRVMVYLGVISYGIYLWHEPMIDRFLSWTNQQTFTVYHGDVPFAWHTSAYVSVPFFAFLVAVLALTIPAASISWFALERPLQRLKGLFGTRVHAA